MLQGALVGGLTGLVATIPNPGLNGFASGAIMDAISGGMGHLASQAISSPNQGIDFGSAGRSILAGAAGGSLGGRLAVTRLSQITRGPLLNAMKTRPFYTPFGQRTISATVGGVSAGWLDTACQK